MPIQDNPLFRRLHRHAQKRLAFEPGMDRSKQLPAYKRYLQLESAMLERYHRKGDSGSKVCQARAAMTDVIVENLFLAALDLYATKHGKIPCKMAVLATGGYGRRELNPHSDIDIMFLYPERVPAKELEHFQGVLAEEILYPLWDLGMKVGHASRNAKEAIAEARKEIQSKNAILESRIICGSDPLYEKLQKSFREFIQKDNPNAYIRQRLEDESTRHAKAGNTIYLQEPDVKNGVGGLRDFQNILWMANIKYGYRSLSELVKAKFLREYERKALRNSYGFLLRTRTELHLQNKRPTDALRLDQQPLIAENLQYPQEGVFERVEAFMKDYYSAARTIYHTSERLKERMALSSKEQKISFKEAFRAHQHLPVKLIDGFRLQDKVLTADSKSVFKEDPSRLIRVFRLMQQFGASLAPELRFLINRSMPLIDAALINSPAAAKSFCGILRSPGEVYPILLQMHELGVLGRYLPEFGQLTCMVQHEYYHRYTADIHVLSTIHHLDNVFAKKDEEYGAYERELRKNDDPLLLYLILLLHDIGKAEGIKGHAISGERIAKPILNRFGISLSQQEQIQFIIRGHLEMARFWQRFDLDDPQTAESFAEVVGDSQKLRFLYVHTYCDARGTAPTLWNGYKEAMHRTLYSRTLEQLENDAKVATKKRRKQIEMLHQEISARAIEGISSEEIEAHFSLLPERYFINTSAQEIELHLRMVNQLLGHIHSADSMGTLSPVIDWNDDIDLGMSVINVVTWDRAGLFYKLAGALSLAGVNIVSTKAISRKDHISIDTFYVCDSDGGVVSNGKAREIFKQRLNEALIENKELLPSIKELEAKLAAKRKKGDLLPAPFPPSVDVYHELTLKRTIIEVQASDRIGLLYRIARLISKKGFDISFARIATERGVAMDTFYIENVDPAKSGNTSNLLELREGLDAIVRGED